MIAGEKITLARPQALQPAGSPEIRQNEKQMSPQAKQKLDENQPACDAMKAWLVHVLVTPVLADTDFLVCGSPKYAGSLSRATQTMLKPDALSTFCGCNVEGASVTMLFSFSRLPDPALKLPLLGEKSWLRF
jgi:hypothetical protein